MTTASNHWAQVACAALGYHEISIPRYRALCLAVRTLCPVDLNERPRCWSDLAATDQQRYVAVLKHSYPGVRDAQLFPQFVKHLLTAYKAEVKRRMQKKSSTDRPKAAYSDTECNRNGDGEPSATMVCPLSQSSETGANRIIQATLDVDHHARAAEF
ncbi:hypothetical protein FN846DRAFT_895872 [Sphaerosporella brunnea]|uniref:Uncharacterized protein n=1 Tax=Sphaerosporella brunnea TaxID=1250544 RepID=A0A5J5EEF7_9PEZI|nr:hypothetical protein FN846DRAFT_895872 [Sphaerosporella brunnea]